MSSDIALRQHVLNELEFEPALDAAHIGVIVEAGVVTLAGYVRSYAERAIAEQAVARVRGVKGLAQELQIRLPHNKKSDDDQIARRALKIIAWDVSLPDDRIRVRVQSGWVTLTGTVEWNYQRSAAEEAVRKLSGVIGITNLVAVRPHVDAKDVKSHIEDALKRNAQLDADAIRVSVDGEKVILEGHVQAWHERSIAEKAARSTAGVGAVEDRVEVR